jgi:hypothetical protein
LRKSPVSPANKIKIKKDFMAEGIITIPSERIVNKIYIIRGRKVMIDRDLAELYGVATGNLNLAVKRNKDRFPEDFMFQLNKNEFKNLILQIETSSWGGIRKLPYVFTEKAWPCYQACLTAKELSR